MKQTLFNSIITGCFVFLAFFVVVFSQPPFAQAMMSIEEEKELREKLLRMVETKVPLVKDPEIVDYINGVGQKILQNVEGKYFDYEFFVIEDQGINAFAMPGGLIFVHTGLLEVISTEDELGCVLAHEIGHIQGRHIARRMERMQAVTLASAAMAIGGLFLGGSQASTAAIVSSGALASSIDLKYSRADEEEADRRADQWLCKAGYDPAGLSSVMKKILQFRWLGSDAIPSYLMTHPDSSQRITYLEDLLQQHPCTNISKKDPFTLQKIQIKIKALTEDPQKLVTKYRQDLAAKPDDLTAHYGLAIGLLTAKEYDEAIQHLKWLASHHPERRDFLADLGKAYYTAGRYDDAIQTLTAFLALDPDDKAVRFYLGSAFLQKGDTRSALPIFYNLRGSWPDRATLYLNLGKCMSGEGRPGEAHYYYYLHYKAIDDYKNAKFHRMKAMALLPATSAMYKELVAEKEKKKGWFTLGEEKEEKDKKTEKDRTARP
jgi:predicted Zn-dependent protease